MVAHRLLGAIRLVNGAIALAAPEVMARRLGTDPDANPAPIYPLRMFGVRTVILGAELLVGDEETRRRSAKLGQVIHASDTVAVALGGARGQLPRRMAAMVTALSALNTLLSFLGSRR
jgi:hypothetical protein